MEYDSGNTEAHIAKPKIVSSWLGLQKLMMALVPVFFFIPVVFNCLLIFCVVLNTWSGGRNFSDESFRTSVENNLGTMVFPCFYTSATCFSTL